MVTDPRLTRCDRPVLHSLSVLLTSTHAPHARLFKHWKGRTDWRIVLLALVRHPHAHSLASSLARSHACFSRLLVPTLACFHASCSLLCLHARMLLRLRTPSLARFLSGSLARFLFAIASCSLALPFWLACPFLARFSSRALPLSLSFFRRDLQFCLYMWPVLVGAVPPSSPRPTCALLP